ncbi:hypothetical protein [Actinophytocola sp.]|uniref:hypothetical protein n=1 Tax=Actinophytocola sp. TaxID=1872138 RepID=UPI003D6A048F
MLSDNAFQINDQLDQNLASDRKSRYGAYLRDKRRLFFHNGADSPPTADPIEFAVTAWLIATPPIMSPRYVVSHPRVQETKVHWDDDYRAALAVEIAVPAPPITHRLPSRWSGWVQDNWSPRWRDPHDNDHLIVLSTVTIRVPLNPNVLPDPTYTAGIPDTSCAKIAVAAMCRTVNAELTNLLTAIDTPASRRTTSGSVS